LGTLICALRGRARFAHLQEEFMRVRLPLMSVAYWVLPLSLCGTWGCGGSPPPADVRLAPAYQNLRNLSIAYAQATTELKRPPKNANELKPHLEKRGIELKDVLHSAVDGAELVIQWGADLSAMKPQEGKYPIWVYEKCARNGKRWVLQARDPVELTEEQFKNSEFAPVRKKA
jgi:hypothetical protein